MNKKQIMEIKPTKLLVKPKDLNAALRILRLGSRSTSNVVEKSGRDG